MLQLRLKRLLEFSHDVLGHCCSHDRLIYDMNDLESTLKATVLSYLTELDDFQRMSLLSALMKPHSLLRDRV